MKEKGKIIYIGKAKNLKKRVYSYFTQKKETELKTIELVKHIEDIEFIITRTEVDALLLENNLIKRHMPRYNIMLKDEKTYPYIKITKEIFPKIEVIRTTKKLNQKNAIYYGPYPIGIWSYLKIMKKLFKVRDCKRDMSKIYPKPCLKYYMKKCLGPCVYKNIEKEYSEEIRDMKNFLDGKIKGLVKDFEEKMRNYSSEMDFEQAIIYRERIEEIKKVNSSNISEYGKDIDEDVFVIKNTDERAFIFVLNVREGKIIGENFIEIDIKKFYYDNLFIQLAMEYYSKYPLTKNIIFDSKYENDKENIIMWCEKVKNKSINIYFPKIKSRRFELLEMANLNLNKREESFFKQKKLLEENLRKLKNRLELKRYPIRIECFDISNIQGKDAVASMSVTIEGKSQNSEYRKFKIKTKDTPDDFAMMQEVLKRRYSKLKREEFPDLILIDGGKGQLSSAYEILESLHKTEWTDIISIAKKEELIFKAGENEPYLFNRKEEALKILQRLRDESHRFGITYHRKLRSKRVMTSFLDEIDGIGLVRKKKLIDRFKTIKNIKRASLEELEDLVPKKVALEIKKREEL